MLELLITSSHRTDGKSEAFTLHRTYRIDIEKIKSEVRVMSDEVYHLSL